MKYVHTKFMLIDPLGADPVFVGGSGNFSEVRSTDADLWRHAWDTWVSVCTAIYLLG